MADKPAGPQEPKPDSKPDPLEHVMLQAGRVHRVEREIEFFFGGAPSASGAGRGATRERLVRVRTRKWRLLFMTVVSIFILSVVVFWLFRGF
jgi:hypothetical protein